MKSSGPAAPPLRLLRGATLCSVVALLFVAVVLGAMLAFVTMPGHSTTGGSGWGRRAPYVGGISSAVRLPDVANSNQKEYAAVVEDLRAVEHALRRVEASRRDAPEPPSADALFDVTPRAARADSSTTSRATPMTDSIFVNIASFRDVQCADTIRNMFDQAVHPHRLFVGALEQNDPKDSGMHCIPPEYVACSRSANSTGSTTRQSSLCLGDNIRVRKVSSRVAKGPTFGRYVANLMYRGETYFMLLDSHSRFLPRWDVRMIDMLQSLPTSKGVLSHYPNSLFDTYKPKDEHGTAFTTVMCNGHFLDNGIFRMDGTSVHQSRLPRLQPFTAAGFLFANARLILEVPFDPYLDYLFDGEEILYTVRMWTHGWDLYAPSESLVLHDYSRHKAPRVWSEPGNQWWAHQQLSNKRVLHILKTPKANTTTPIISQKDIEALPASEQTRLLASLDKYGLGTERTVEEFWKFANVDPVTRNAKNDLCARIAAEGGRP